MSLIVLSVDWTQTRKEPVVLKICQRKLPKLKTRRKKKRLEHPRNVEQLKKM